MWKLGVLCTLALSGAALAGEPAAPAAIPSSLAWVYPGLGAQSQPFPQMQPDIQYGVTGSTLVLSGQQINDMSDAIDWLPATHPSPPATVQRYDAEKKRLPCADCHGLNGKGNVATPDLGGLPRAYIVEQIHEFKSGHRKSSVTDRPTTEEMIGIAGKLSAAELDEAARYFSSLKPPAPVVRVVETDQVPRTKAHSLGWLELIPNGGTEPIGRRVIVVADDFTQQWINDPHALSVAYVPPQAIERGKALAHRTGPGIQACTACHGADLKGSGAIPRLAGRDPAYLARALWDIKSGARNGPAVALMQKPAGAVKEDEIVDLVAYIASLAP
jgi:cytochrome c553